MSNLQDLRGIDKVLQIPSCEGQETWQRLFHEDLFGTGG
jgi:hypothetical protein